MAMFVMLVPADDLANELKEFIANLYPAEEKKNEVRSAFSACGNNPEALMSAACQHSEVVISNSSEKEAESFIACLIYLARKTKNVVKEKELLDKMLENICQKGGVNPSFRFNAILKAYNSVHEKSAKRCEIFTLLLRFALATNQQKRVRPYLENFKQLIEEWNAGKENERKVVRAAYDVLESLHDPESFKMLKLLLALYNGENEETLASVADLAKRVILQSVQLESNHHRDEILDFDAVKQLENTEKPLFQLAKIFAFDGVTEFDTWAKANNSILQQYNLSEGQLRRTVQLLSLTCIATAATESTISYKTAATALQVKEEEVEEWVVDCIVRGMLEARINQLDGTIRIVQGEPRGFKIEDWENLHKLFDNLHQNLYQITNMMNQSNVAR